MNTYFWLHFHSLPNMEIFNLASLNCVNNLGWFFLFFLFFFFSFLFLRGREGLQHGILSLELETHLDSNPCSVLISWVIWEVPFYSPCFVVFISTVRMRPLIPGGVKTKEIILIKMHLAWHTVGPQQRSLPFLYFASFLLSSAREDTLKWVISRNTLEAERHPYQKVTSPSCISRNANWQKKYIYIYTHIYIHTHTCKYICIYTYIPCIYVCVCIYILLYIDASNESSS